MNAEEVRVKIDANRINTQNKLKVVEKANIDKTIKYWEQILIDLVNNNGSEYKTSQIHSSNWLPGKSNTYGALDLNVEQTVKEHFQARGIAFKKELNHSFQCDCNSEIPCCVFYYLDVS